MTVNIHDTPPFVASKDNVCVSRTGDVNFVYEMFLPEKHSMAEEEYDEFNTIMTRAFKFFDKDTVIHKMDMCLKKRFNASQLSTKTYLTRTYKEQNAKKEHAQHSCYLVFTWTIADIINADEFINPFKRLTNEKQIIEALYETQFPDTVENAVEYVNSTKKIYLRKLDNTDTQEICRSYFTGLLQGIYSDVQGEGKDHKIGERFIDIYTLHSLRQFPPAITNTIIDPKLSSKGRTFLQGITEPFGVDIKFDHIVNQIIFIPAHEKLFSKLRSTAEEFHSARGFGMNEGPAKAIKAYLQKLNDDKAGAKLVQAHFNVIVFTDNDSQRKEARHTIQNNFTDKDIKPYVPTGNAKKALFTNSFFAFSSRLPKRFTFITELEMACALFIPTTTYKDDKEGIYFSDRLFNIPIRRDVWDQDKRRIKSRNFGVIAPTGYGKSTLCQHLAYQFIEQNYKLVINDQGNSFQNLYRMYKDRSTMLNFKPGVPMGINPFETDDPNKVDTNRIQYLNDLINLFHFKGSIAADKIATGHNTSLRKIISAYYSTANEFNMKTFYKFFEFVHKNKRYEEIGIDPGIYDPTSTMGEVIYSLSEFTEGIYGYLFEKPKDDRGLFRITPDTDFVYFEFAGAGEDTLLQAILQQYSFQATREVIWEDKSKRGVMLNDEYAKFLKYPAVAASTEYAAQTIRKYNGAFGFVIQSVAQLPKTDTIGAILDNTPLFYILPTDKNHHETAERLKLEAHHRPLLDSIEANFTGQYPYNEVFLLMGKYGMVARVQLPEEHYYTFQTEGHLYNLIEDTYRKYNDMPKTIDEIIRTIKTK
jgi:conjugal transfer ATP-binding protein TraC